MSTAADTTPAPTVAAAPAAISLSRAGASALHRARAYLVPLTFPLGVLAIWHVMTYGRKYSLIPPPNEVALAMYDLAVGGINDDAFSQTLHIHLVASMSRVYGGFALALAVALPLGLMLGRIPLVRRLLDPTLQVMRPIPVTAWLPLAMIMFGLGPRSAVFLVCLGAFYPILINTIFGVRSVDPRLFEAASMLGCQGSAQFFKVVLPLAKPGLVAVGIISFIDTWNAFLVPLVLTNFKAMTAPVVILSYMETEEKLVWGLLSAGGFLTILPILVFSLALNRYLLRGLTAGSVK